MDRNGFTLIEMLVACALLTAALGMIWAVWLGANDTAEVLGRKTTATDATIHAMHVITRELRATALSQLPDVSGEELHYRIPEDRDGNGLPVDANGAPEWGAPRRIGRDHADANGDGLSGSQLILEREGNIEVLANGLLPPGAESGHGIWFDISDRGVLVSVAVSSTSRRKLDVSARAVQRVVPRNP